jgi:beta-lactamase class C
MLRTEDLQAQFERLAKENSVEAAVLVFERGRERQVFTHGVAKRNSVFLLASITKPMTAIAVMQLVDRGLVKLGDPVQKYIPEFGDGRVVVRHLLTHTSGLPDMLPENEALRKRHAGLKEFVAGACQVPLLFAPGTKQSYQSMGILLAAEIVERVTKQKLPGYLEANLFRPLGMKQTSLGLGSRRLEETVRSQSQDGSDWDWNSAYWRKLGAPWGGAFATAEDVLKLLSYFAAPDERVLKVETARMMIADQNVGLNKEWGLGWGVDGKRGTFGHSGSVGTLCWAHRAKQGAFVLLTSKPAAESSKPMLEPLSAAAISFL